MSETILWQRALNKQLAIEVNPIRQMKWNLENIFEMFFNWHHFANVHQLWRLTLIAKFRFEFFFQFTICIVIMFHRKFNRFDGFTQSYWSVKMDGLSKHQAKYLQIYPDRQAHNRSLSLLICAITFPIY